MPAPRYAWFWLILGLAAASQSGNIIRLGDAHPAAIAFWRVLLALVVLLPLGLPQRSALGAMPLGCWLLLVGGGAALAVHWLTWIAAVQRTTVANAAVLYSVNPVILAVAGHYLLGERVGPRLLASIGLGVLGVGVMGAGNLRFAPNQWEGDLYALLTAVFFAVYFLAGKILRRRLPGRIYVSSVYAVACVGLAVSVAALDLPLVRYDRDTWLCFLGMAVFPTLLGHTGLNIALGFFAVSRLSVSTLSEPLLAGLVAFLAWNETITVQTAFGYVLICCSVVLLALDRAPDAGEPARQTPSMAPTDRGEPRDPKHNE